MRNAALFIFSMIIILAGCTDDASPTENKENQTFEIKINRWAMMDDSWWTITSDSVVVTTKIDLDRVQDTFVHHWTDAQRAEIQRMINSWDTTSFEGELLIDNVPDCEREFDFIITLNGKEFKIHAYLEKIDELYEFSNYIDNVLPEPYRITYNEAYLLQER